MKRVKTSVPAVVFFPVFGHSVGTNSVSTRCAPRRKPGANGKRGAVPFKSRSARGGVEETGRKRPVFRQLLGLFPQFSGTFRDIPPSFRRGCGRRCVGAGRRRAFTSCCVEHPGDGVPRGGVRYRDVPRRRVIFGEIRADRAPYAGRHAAFRRGNFVYQPKNLKFAD